MISTSILRNYHHVAKKTSRLSTLQNYSRTLSSSSHVPSTMRPIVSNLVKNSNTSLATSPMKHSQILNRPLLLHGGTMLFTPLSPSSSSSSI
mmetsp:Transcript_8246/g.12333  ORF Transcript_8246/g.12333 Transcript_8246/m.12333 type:complete len:92 (+) Transcript_8246:67-342(+)